MLLHRYPSIQGQGRETRRTRRPTTSVPLGLGLGGVATGIRRAFGGRHARTRSWNGTGWGTQLQRHRQQSKLVSMTGEITGGGGVNLESCLSTDGQLAHKVSCLSGLTG